jgi:ribosomal protein S18 acetylase RimI-like enzyme
MVWLQRMSEADYQAYLDKAVRNYAQEHVAAGNWLAEEALERAKKQYDDLLPQGTATENQFLFNVMAEAEIEPVGMLWFAAEKREGALKAFLYDIEIYESFRRRGYGEGALLALEEKVRALGLTTISLHVFGHNHSARALYKKHGYVETNVIMAKTLDE